jgi:Trk K+ transport system NAD-binding subunit
MPSGEPSTSADTTRSAISTWVQRRLFWRALLVVTLVLGVWGFLLLPPPMYPPRPLDALYRTARLFTLNLDLAQPDPKTNWQVWTAAWLAPILLVRGIAELFRERLHGVAARFLVRRRRMVVFGAGDGVNALVRAARLTSWTRWWQAVIVADLDQAALSAARELGAWTVAADGLTAASLRKAAVSKSSVVVVMTDDDQRNAMIATEVGRILAKGQKGRIYVNVGSPALARTLERSGLPDHVETTPFSPLALAAADVMDELDRLDGALFTQDGAPSVVLFGQGPLVDAVVLEVRRRQRVRLVVAGKERLPAPRVLLVGPGAEEHVKRLEAMLGPEPDLLKIEAIDDPLTQTVELREDTARKLLSRDLGRVMVLAADDLTGGSIAITLARHLGRGRKLTLVTEGPDSTFGQHIAERSTTDPTMAVVRVFRVPELACSLRRLEDHRAVFRLARALYEATPTQRPWAKVDDATRRTFRARAEELMDTIEVPLRAGAFMAFDPPQVNLLGQLGFDEFAALSRAGLVPELRDPEVLKKIGSRLVERDKAMALEAWCEVARLATTSAELTDPPAGTGTRADDIRRLLWLRRAQFGDDNAKIALRASGVGSGPAGDVIVILGMTVAPELRGLVGWALGTLPYHGTVFAPAVGRVGDLVRDCAAPDKFDVQPLSANAEQARRQVLDLWTARVDAAAGSLRVLALPDDPTIWPLVQLFRTLGAPVAWLPLEHDPATPERMLLGGAAGIAVLPNDRATVRAFLRPSRWPYNDTTKDIVAAALHRGYVERQGAHNAVGDPALRPFDQLAPALQDSNRDVVDDIPTKLAMAGLRLCSAVDAAWPTPWPPDPATRELLAEMEHGRFNAERLLRGWRLAARDTGRFLSPHLVSWAELEQTWRELDYAIIADLPAALAEAGLGAA